MKFRYLALLLLPAVVFSCRTIDIEPSANDAFCSPDEVLTANLSGEIVPGMLRVKFKQEPASIDDISAMLPEITVTNAHRTFTEDPRFEERTRAEGMHLWYDIAFEEKVEVTKVAVSVNANSNIEFVEGVRIAKPQTVWPFNDPAINRLWHYSNDGSAKSWVAGADAGVLEAWNVETGNENVVVAVIDAGVRYTHEDLRDAMWINEPEFNGQLGVDDDGNGFVDDIYGFNFCATSGSSFVGTVHPEDHGTHVAGTIAAVNNNGLGGCGIAGGNGSHKGARVMTCQIIDGNLGAYDADAFKYACDNGAIICNNSWSQPGASGVGSSLRAGIEYFKKYAGLDENGKQVAPMAGGLVLFAAGNDSKDVCWPAMDDCVYAVSAIASNWKAAYYTNYGSWVDIAAPGGDAQLGPQIYSCVATNDSAYDAYQGTSMACPHVSGVAALVVSHYGGPGFTPEKLWNILCESANSEDLYKYNDGKKGQLGVGMVNAGAALSNEGPLAPEKVTGVKASARANTVDVTWKVAVDPESGKAAYNTVYYSKKSLADFTVSASGKASDPSVDYVVVPSGATAAGDEISTSIAGLDFSTTYYIRVCASDKLDNYGPVSDMASVKTGDNSKPEVVAVDGTSARIKEHESATLNFNVSDKDGHALTASLSKQTKGITLTSITDGKCSVVFDGKTLGVGEVSVNLVVSDGYDDTVTALTCTVVGNEPPVVVKTMEDMIFGSKSEVRSINLAEYFNDPDGEALAYDVQSSSTSIIVKPEVKGDKLDLTANWYGTTTLTVTATDGMGKKVSQSFKVLVRDGSVKFDLYPNPVVDKLNIRSANEQKVDVKIFSGAGAKLFDSSLTVGAFNPAQVDMSDYRAGSYTVIIKSGDSEDKYVVVKSK